MTDRKVGERRTPRTLKIEIEIDVTEGPRIRRGTTESYVNEAVGRPLLDLAVERARDKLGLIPSKAMVRTSWQYTWFDAKETAYYPGSPEWETSQKIREFMDLGPDGWDTPFEISPGTFVTIHPVNAA